MKRVVVILALGVTLFGCQKNRTENNSLVAGNWELRKSEGGISGTINYLPGNGNIYDFENDGSYKRYAAGTVDETGTFRIDNSPIAGQMVLILDAPSYSDTISIRIIQQELIFLKKFECCDYPDVTYEKIAGF